MSKPEEARIAEAQEVLVRAREALAGLVGPYRWAAAEAFKMDGPHVLRDCADALSAALQAQQEAEQRVDVLDRMLADAVSARDRLERANEKLGGLHRILQRHLSELQAALRLCLSVLDRHYSGNTEDQQELEDALARGRAVLDPPERATASTD